MLLGGAGTLLVIGFFCFSSLFSIGSLLGFQTHIVGDAALGELGGVSHEDQLVGGSFGFTDLDDLGDLSAEVMGHIERHFADGLVVAHHSQRVQILGKRVLASDCEPTEHRENGLFFHF